VFPHKVMGAKYPSCDQHSTLANNISLSISDNVAKQILRSSYFVSSSPLQSLGFVFSQWSFIRCIQFLTCHIFSADQFVLNTLSLSTAILTPLHFSPAPLNFNTSTFDTNTLKFPPTEININTLSCQDFAHSCSSTSHWKSET
jgi:hypothetical protein